MLPRDRKITNNQTAEAVVNTTESGTIGVIFAMLKGWVFESWHYGLFPLAGALSLIRAGLVIRQATLEQGENKETIARAVMESVGALAMNTAVVFTFVGAAVASAAVLAVAAPIIFTATLGAKSLYSLGVACYYLAKAFAEKDGDDRNEFLQAARENFIGFIAGSLVTAAVGLVLIAAQPVWSILGMVGAAIGFGFGGYTLYKAWDDRKILKSDPAPSVPANPKVESEPAEAATPDLSSKLTNAKVHKTLMESQTAATPRPAAITPVTVASAAAATRRVASPVRSEEQTGCLEFLSNLWRKERTLSTASTAATDSTDSVQSFDDDKRRFSDFPVGQCHGLNEYVSDATQTTLTDWYVAKYKR